MKTSTNLAERIAAAIIPRIDGKRAPDFVIGAGSPGGPYLRRWYITPWRRWRDQAEANPTRWNRCKAAAARMLPNVYLHCFHRDDDDRALQDHPSWAVSYMIRGAYIEHTIEDGGIHRRNIFIAGHLRCLPATKAHRIELFSIDTIFVKTGPNSYDARGCSTKKACAWTLFMFGPTLREWGFHCPHRGWVPWQEFTAAGKPGEVGQGCGDG